MDTMNLRLFSMQLSKTVKWVAGTLLVLSVIGFIDASYLSIEHYLGRVPPCAITTGCEQVTTSEYNTILGVYVAVYGAVFYLVMFVLVLYALDRKRYELFRYAAYFSWAGLGAAIYFTSVQAFVLNAYCIYCLASAATSTCIFLAAHRLWLEVRKEISRESL